jgi:hypothetical protein
MNMSAKLSLRRPSTEHAESPRPIREYVALTREAERLTKEPEADFFVSIPKSKKTALKTYCVQQGISMRDWLLQAMQEKGIGVEGAEATAPAKRGKPAAE